MGVAKGGSWGSWDPPILQSENFFIKDEVVYEVYCTQYAFYAHQRWSPRGSSRPVDHVLGLGFQVLGLGLGLRLSVLGLRLEFQVLGLGLGLAVLGLGNCP